MLPWYSLTTLKYEHHMATSPLEASAAWALLNLVSCGHFAFASNSPRITLGVITSKKD